MTLTRGESVLLTLGIPVILLAFFSAVDVLPSGGDDAVRFLYPGVLALAVMSTSMVSLAIATGFERSYGVLKRLGATPLGRGRLLIAKTLTVVTIQVLQVTVLTVEAVMLGFRFERSSAIALASTLAAVALATAAFAGIGFVLAGRLPALTTLAVANGLYIVLLLLSGMLVPLDRLPGAVAALARGLPSGALVEALRGALVGAAVPVSAWVVLGVWAVAAPVAASRLFRWE